MAEFEKSSIESQADNNMPNFECDRAWNTFDWNRRTDKKLTLVWFAGVSPSWKCLIYTSVLLDQLLWGPNAFRGGRYISIIDNYHYAQFSGAFLHEKY